MNPFKADWFMDNKGDSNWATRRRIIIFVLLWSSGLITYITVYGQQDSLRESVATNLILLMGGVIGSYVFGVEWGQKNKASTGVASQAIARSDSITVETKVEQ